jgi:hypothetical protein
MYNFQQNNLITNNRPLQGAVRGSLRIYSFRLHINYEYAGNSVLGKVGIDLQDCTVP